MKLALFRYSKLDTRYVEVAGDTMTGALSVGSTTTPVGRLILPMGEIAYFNTTGTSVTISAQSDGSTNMVKVGPTTALSANAYETDNGGANTGILRYTGTTTKHFHVACSISFSGAVGGNVFVAGIAKNGTVIAASKVLRKVGASGDVGSTAMHVMTSMDTNDYLEVYAGNTSGTGNFTIMTINLFAMGM